MKIVDKDGNTVRLKDRDRTLLENLEPSKAERICRELNEYVPRSTKAPFAVKHEVM